MHKHIYLEYEPDGGAVIQKELGGHPEQWPLFPMF